MRREGKQEREENHDGGNRMDDEPSSPGCTSSLSSYIRRVGVALYMRLPIEQVRSGVDQEHDVPWRCTTNHQIVRAENRLVNIHNIQLSKDVLQHNNPRYPTVKRKGFRVRWRCQAPLRESSDNLLGKQQRDCCLFPSHQQFQRWI